MSRIHLFALTFVATSIAWTSTAQADDATPADKSAASPSAEKPAAGTKLAGQGTAIVDFDNDGVLDLFVAEARTLQGVASQLQQLSEYWIGIDGTPADDALRAQLEIPVGQGLLVNQVLEASPSAKAGLKPYDVLLTCNEAPLGQISDLAKIIAEKKKTALALRLVRGGKRIIIEVTPDRRPASQTGETCPSISKTTDEEFARRVWLDLTGSIATPEEIQGFIAEKREKKREWLVNRLLRRSTVANKSCTACHANDGDGIRLYNSLVDLGGHVLWTQHLNNSIRFDTLRGRRLLALPNTVVQLQPQVLSDLVVQPLADDVTVSISRKGQEPTRITVRKGDRIWEFNASDEASKVSEEARALVGPFVSSLPSTLSQYLNDYFVGRGRAALFLNTADGTFVDVTRDVNVNVAPVTEPSQADQQKPAAADSAFDRLDKQVESLNVQLGELRRAMQELRQSIKPEAGKSQK